MKSIDLTSEWGWLIFIINIIKYLKRQRESLPVFLVRLQSEFWSFTCFQMKLQEKLANQPQRSDDIGVISINKEKIRKTKRKYKYNTFKNLWHSAERALHSVGDAEGNRWLHFRVQVTETRKSINQSTLCQVGDTGTIAINQYLSRLW